MTTKSDQSLLSVHQVAKLLSVSPDTVRRNVGAWGLTTVRLGARTIRYRTDEVQKLIDQRSYKIA